MALSRMYAQRPKQGNIPVVRGCRYGCVYCENTFKRLIMLNKGCPMCAIFEPHFHPEALSKAPPKTEPGQFVTIGLSGDVSFCSHDQLVQISSYCAKWSDRTFVIQSKSPAVFLQHYWPDNVILGTTLETNYSLLQSSEPSHQAIAYNEISKAPYPEQRRDAMLKMKGRQFITIEPILKFSIVPFSRWIKAIGPEFVYIGYASDKNDGKKLKLPEPSLEETMRLITDLKAAGIEVRAKELRKAWWEE